MPTKIVSSVLCQEEPLTCEYPFPLDQELDKHEKVLNEPLGDKAVTELPGIDHTLGLRLRDAGFDKASMLLGMFLVSKKNPEVFLHWLTSTCGADLQQATHCCCCLVAWWALNDHA